MCGVSPHLFPAASCLTGAAVSTWRCWRAFSRLLLRGERTALCRRRPARPDAYALTHICASQNAHSVLRDGAQSARRPQLRRLFLMYGHFTGRIERSLSAAGVHSALKFACELGDLDVAWNLAGLLHALASAVIQSPAPCASSRLLSFSGSSASKREYVAQIPSATAPPLAASPALFSCHLIPRVARQNSGSPLRYGPMDQSNRRIYLPHFRGRALL